MESTPEPASKTTEQIIEDEAEKYLRAEWAAIFGLLKLAATNDGEKAIAKGVQAVIRGGATADLMLKGLPYRQDVDKVHYEYALKRGRADFVIFHADGSASVIELKDGKQGISSVLAGIGQVTEYAVQLKMFGGVERVHRALMWTRIPELDQNRMVTAACREAGVVPLAALSRELLVIALADAFGVELREE